MASRFNIRSFAPSGLVVDDVTWGEEMIVITAHGDADAAACPACGTLSRRVQSRYVRHPSDLPCAGRCVRLQLVVRRFRCGVPVCPRQVFAEGFDTAVLAGRARRTGRLEQIVRHLGLALGGRPGASLARQLMLPVSSDTLLRVVRRHAQPRTEPLAVIGIDDWAEQPKVPPAQRVEWLRRDGGATIATAPSSVTSSADAWWRCCPIAR